MPWNAFKMNEFDPPDELTPGSIVKLMKTFEKDFKVNTELHMHPTMLVWLLELEDKVSHIRTRSRVQERKETDLPPPVRKYMCSLCVKEELFFINRCFSKKLQLLMAKALHCAGFEPLDMEAGNPSSLRLLYAQSEKINPGELEFQNRNRAFNLLHTLKSGFPISDNVDTEPDKHKEVHMSLGTDRDMIPQISSVKVSVKKAPIKSNKPTLKGYRFSNIDIQVSAPSIFHFYLDLAEKGIIKELPPWLQKMRSRGSTQVNTVYN